MPQTIKEAEQRLNLILKRGLEISEIFEALEFFLKLQKEFNLQFRIIYVMKYNNDYLAIIKEDKKRIVEKDEFEGAARLREEEKFCKKIIETVKEKEISTSRFIINEKGEADYYCIGDSDTEIYLKEIILEIIKRKR